MNEQDYKQLALNSAYQQGYDAAIRDMLQRIHGTGSFRKPDGVRPWHSLSVNERLDVLAQMNEVQESKRQLELKMVAKL